MFNESLYVGWDTYGPLRIFSIVKPDDITPEDVEKARALLKFYTGGDGNFEPQYFDQLVKMFTDAFPLFAVHQTIKAFVAQNMKVFHYILTYKGGLSLLDISYGLPPTGVCHADDLLYLFDPVFQYLGVDPDAPVLTGTDLEVSDLMISAWTNFAIFGDPTPPDMLDVTWLPIGPGNFQYLNISSPNPQMAYADNIRDRMEFWTELMK